MSEQRPSDPIAGTQPPQDYIGRQEWAKAQLKAGLRQRQCPTCRLWFFPQEAHPCSK